MTFPIPLVYPKGDIFVMETVQTDLGRVQQPKSISARNEDELAMLKRIGWVEKDPPVDDEVAPIVEEVPEQL